MREKRRNKSWTQEELEQFVRQWQTSNTVQEVADALGLSKQHVSNTAVNLRKKDVPLKRMNPPKAKHDYDALIRVANESIKGDSDVNR